MFCFVSVYHFFFFNDTATTEIYTLSLHDALPIWYASSCWARLSRNSSSPFGLLPMRSEEHTSELQSHSFISYAVFCLNKNKRPSFSSIPVNPPQQQALSVPRRIP